MARTHDRLNAFTIGYAHGMLWANTASVNAKGEPDGSEVCPEWWQTPSATWQLEAFDSDSRASIEADCMDFFIHNWRDLRAYVAQGGMDWRGQGGLQGELAGYECAGHDFALSRNGHGAGFFDRGMGELGDRLQDAARVYGASDAWTTDEDSEAHLNDV